MIIENSDALKVWLTSCLGRMCDADPAALAKYVLALVKKEKSENELREFCLDQLEVFLLKDTKQFVDLLFEALKTKSYLHRAEITSNVASNDAPVNSSKKLGLSDLKEKNDGERDLQKSENVPKSKPVHFISNSRTHSHSKGVSKRNSRERRDRNHRSRSHSSSSRSSRSSSRERLKEKCESYKHKQELPKVDDRHRELVVDNSGFSHAPYANNIKGSNRCKDYDEKGYCMQGDLCIYDHGNDPVVLESASVLNFGGPLGTHVPPSENSIIPTSLDITKSPLPPPPPTSPPPLPPPPPPLPPLPAAVSGAYIPEPYNPEAPAMNISSPANIATYWMPSNIHIPSIHHSRPQPLSGMSNNQHIMAQHNSKPRTRELIGVPTVEVIDSNKNTSVKTISTVPIIKKRKGFDYSRLGPKPKRINSEPLSRTLELRRVPKHLNTIALLNSHFSKFGNITNIEVFYDSDPEAALIQFQNHTEAAMAHNSTDAVLNNRFIQVLWHNKEEKNNLNITEKLDTAPHKFKSHLKEVMPNNFEVSNDEKFPSSARVFNAERSTSEKLPERSVVYSRGNICRTVFNPAVLKKADISSSVSTPQKDEKKVNKKLELYKKKQNLLEEQIKNQKVILAKLSTAKNEKERTLLKEILETLGTKIKQCQYDLKEFLKQINSPKTPTPHSKSEAEKLLLDAEMDLYNTLNKCDGDNQQDTAELLLLKVNELKQKAKAFGLLDSSEIGLKTKRRQLQFPKSNNSLSLKIDNRPKTLLVSGVQDKDTTKKHFQQFGDIEKIDENKSGITVTYKTRKMAEMAFARSKLGDENLSVSWFLEEQHSASEDVKDANAAKLKNDNLHFVDGDEDEDEEEDSEARSWRR